MGPVSYTHLDVYKRQVLLVVFAAGLAVGVLMAHWLSLDVAQTYPEVAHLRAPAFWLSLIHI